VMIRGLLCGLVLLNRKQFQRFLDRDGGCLHCGDVVTAVPQHRINRGMGGSKLLDGASNIIVLCAYMNGLIESNFHAQQAAIDKGWKLWHHDDPRSVPVFDAQVGEWFTLTDDFGRVAVK